MTFGCCGSHRSLSGLIAEADEHPASTPRGQVARARVAYTIAAGHAARTGNKAAYQRALSGLETVSAAEAAAATAGVQNLVNRVAPQVSGQLAIAGTYINLVLSAAQIGTGIASSACSGCDRTGIDVVNTIISWVRAILSGATPTIPTLTPDRLQGFVDFCRVEPMIKGAVEAAFEIASAAAYGTRNDAAGNAIIAIQGFITNFLDSICAIPQISAAVAAASAPPPPPPPEPVPTVATADCVAAGEPHSARALDGSCVCIAGYTLDNTRPRGQRCVPNFTFVPGPIRPGSTVPTVRCADGTVRPVGTCPTTAAPTSAGAAKLLVPIGAAALWFFLR